MKTLATCAAAALALLATNLLAASPAMFTAPGSSAACGSAGLDLCSPAADVFANFPAATPATLSGSAALNLLPGDVVTSFSFGREHAWPASRIRFSVGNGSAGIAGVPPDVASEALAADHAADIFDGGTVSHPMANARLVDGNGLPAMAAPASGLAEPGDELRDFASCSPSSANLVGSAVYFSLAPGSPTLAALSATSADLLSTQFLTAAPVIVATTAATLGLVAGDVIDALMADPVGPYFGAPIVLSLADGSPSLATIPASGADLLYAPGPGVLISAAALGLGAGDDIDGLDISNDADGDLVADDCDGCPSVVDNDQIDTDGDLEGDACDPCPHLFNGSSSSSITLETRKLLLHYGASGPGSGDDRPKIVRAAFTTTNAFDPAAGGGVHVRIRESLSHAVLFHASLTASSGLWNRPNPTRKRWIYRDADPTAAPGAIGVRRALLVERPPGSNQFVFTLAGRNADIAAGFAAASENLQLTLEIEGSGALCLSDDLPLCTARPTSDLCRNP